LIQSVVTYVSLCGEGCVELKLRRNNAERQAALVSYTADALSNA